MEEVDGKEEEEKVKEESITFQTILTVYSPSRFGLIMERSKFTLESSSLGVRSV